MFRYVSHAQLSFWINKVSDTAFDGVIIPTNHQIRLGQNASPKWSIHMKSREGKEWVRTGEKREDELVDD